MTPSLSRRIASTCQRSAPKSHFVVKVDSPQAVVAFRTSLRSVQALQRRRTKIVSAWKKANVHSKPDSVLKRTISAGLCAFAEPSIQAPLLLQALSTTHTSAFTSSTLGLGLQNGLLKAPSLSASSLLLSSEVKQES